MNRQINENTLREIVANQELEGGKVTDEEKDMIRRYLNDEISDAEYDKYLQDLGNRLREKGK